MYEIKLCICEACGHAEATAEEAMPYSAYDNGIVMPGGRWGFRESKGKEYFACPNCPTLPKKDTHMVFRHGEPPKDGRTYLLKFKGGLSALEALDMGDCQSHSKTKPIGGAIVAAGLQCLLHGRNVLPARIWMRLS